MTLDDVAFIYTTLKEETEERFYCKGVHRIENYGHSLLYKIFNVDRFCYNFFVIKAVRTQGSEAIILQVFKVNEELGKPHPLLYEAKAYRNNYKVVYKKCLDYLGEGI